MSDLNDSEERLAGELLALIDFTSRVLHTTHGTEYQHQKTGQVARAAEQFRLKLGGDQWEALPDPIDQDKVEAFVAANSQKYALGRALYPGGKPRAIVPLTGFERVFATETVERAMVALGCNKQGKPWPEWSEHEWVAVAIVLGDDDRLAKAHFHNMLGPVRTVGAAIGVRYACVIDAEPLFNTIRADLDAQLWAKDWMRMCL
ncbi:hypothetical protein [Glycomyces sp. YM15]|uniref:hypothetical protein n=1 Tax=Glycomyces sp. YM15 TaxID=2800446 RepID=UPI0019637673|nr:hypothetical protein [Glycomyces sp. YM15]